jgi:hypothetical protein
MEAMEGSDSMKKESAVNLLVSHTVVQFRNSIFTLHKQRCRIFSQIRLLSVPLRSAWGCSAPENPIFRRNTKTTLLCLHVNKSPKHSIVL